jgi:hypothetical protein
MQYIKKNAEFDCFQIIILSIYVTAFEVTPLMHCSTNLLALFPAPWTTRPHPLHKNGASIVEVLPMQYIKKNAEFDCFQIIILSIYVPSTHA